MSNRTRIVFSVAFRAAITVAIIGCSILLWTGPAAYCRTPDNSAATDGQNGPPNITRVREHIEKGDALAKKLDIESLEQAICEYEAALKLDPKNYDALCRISDAYIRILDIKTNCLIVEKDEHKSALKRYGRLAQKYAKTAYKINPKGKDAVRANLQSYGYYSASMGIVTAILKGAAGHYIDLAEELIALDDAYWGATGYRSLGRLYYVAPWPLGNYKKAMKCYRKAAAKAPEVLETHYWLGMLHLEKKKLEAARKEFQLVVAGSPTELERHYIGEFKKAAQKQLTKIGRRKS
jgi:tetratricopeptide (TPR) repeat protein